MFQHTQTCCCPRVVLANTNHAERVSFVAHNRAAPCRFIPESQLGCFSNRGHLERVLFWFADPGLRCHLRVWPHSSVPSLDLGRSTPDRGAAGDEKGSALSLFLYAAAYEMTVGALLCIGTELPLLLGSSTVEMRTDGLLLGHCYVLQCHDSK